MEEIGIQFVLSEPLNYTVQKKKAASLRRGLVTTYRKDHLRSLKEQDDGERSFSRGREGKVTTPK